jgi:plastocyanin
MGKLLLLLATAVAVLAAAGGATAATATVTITKAGYVPSSTTIAQGDSVQFVNGDTAAHQVSFKGSAGVTCTPNPLVLQPGQTGTCPFLTAGSYMYSDPNAKGNTYRGTITINATQAAISFAAAPRSVVYGGHVISTGTDSTHRVGENVDVYAQQCGQSAANKVATVQTSTDGAFSATTQPLMNTAYAVKIRSATSPSVSVTVRPKVRVGKVAPHRYSVRLSAATSFAGKYASFQRYNGTRWIALKTVALHANTTGVAPTVITSASFRSSLASGKRVRVVISQVQVGTCYLAGISNTILS